MSATFTQAVDELVVDPIRATGRNPEDYDVGAIADHVVEVWQGEPVQLIGFDPAINGFVCMCDNDMFWQVVEEHHRG